MTLHRLISNRVCLNPSSNLRVLSALYNTSQKRNASKVFDDPREAIKPVQSGHKLIVGGFGLSGTPQKLIEAVKESGVNNLTVVSNNCGVDDWGLGLLLQTRQVERYEYESILLTNNCIDQKNDILLCWRKCYI